MTSAGHGRLAGRATLQPAAQGHGWQHLCAHLGQVVIEGGLRAAGGAHLQAQAAMPTVGLVGTGSRCQALLWTCRIAHRTSHTWQTPTRSRSSRPPPLQPQPPHLGPARGQQRGRHVFLLVDKHGAKLLAAGLLQRVVDPEHAGLQRGRSGRCWVQHGSAVRCCAVGRLLACGKGWPEAGRSRHTASKCGGSRRRTPPNAPGRTLPTHSLRRNSRDCQAKGSSRVVPSRRPCKAASLRGWPAAGGWRRVGGAGCHRPWRAITATSATAN